jgi:hypothetical protein
MDAIRARLDAFPTNLAPLVEAARGLLGRPCALSSDGVMFLGHRPWVAPENYAITLYPGVTGDALRRYCERWGLSVPGPYSDFLAVVSGAFCFGMSLAGLPPSMLGEPPLLDRSRLWCHDLASVATRWTAEYRRVSPDAFHFGYRHFSRRENIGYFFDGDRIVSIRKSGRVVGEWGGFSDFLRDELRASEQLDAELHPAPPA